MKKFNLSVLMVITVAFVLGGGGCAKKARIPRADVSRLEAERSIAIAQSEIDEAKEVGADVAEPESILDNAKKLLRKKKYRSSKSEADKAGKMARRRKDELLAGVRSKEDAESAIERAKKFISEARSLGGNVIKPEKLISEAKAALEDEKYSEAVKLADSAAEIAKSIINSLRGIKYTVGTWEADKDCLWNIAAKKRIYGDPWKWKRIFKANRRRIKDPDLIYPNQVLIIPKD